MKQANLKILHVVPTYAPAFRYGGTIISSHGLTKALVEMGHQVTVCTTNVDGPHDMDFPQGASVDRDGVNVHYFPVSKVFKRLSRRLYYSPQMKRWLESNIADFDVVHLHSVFLWPTNAAARIAKQFNVPYVLAPRGMLVKDLINKKSSLLKKAWIKFIESKTIESASLLHFTSNQELVDAQHLLAKFGSYCVVPNGVELEGVDLEVESKESGSENNSAKQRYLLFLGRINWKKGLEVLLIALSKSAHADLKLVLAGNDEEGYQEELEAQAETLGISHQLAFLGFVEGEPKKQLITNAECLLLCSKNENFGNVVLESLAQARPVIVTEGVGASTIITEHNAGLVVENADTQEQARAIANAIDALWSQPELANEMGDRGRRIVQQEYSWQSVAKKIVKQYDKVLLSRSGNV